ENFGLGSSEKFNGDLGMYLRIKPPRRLKKKYVKRLVEKRVAKAIEEYEKTMPIWIMLEVQEETLRMLEELLMCRVTLTLKGDDIEAYNNLFHELALMCTELVPNEKKNIERYIRGFPKGIKGNITFSRPTTLHDAINMARELVEQAVQGRAARISESNKRKWKEQQGNNHHQQQNQRQEAGKAYVAAPAKGKGYAGNLPWCKRCKAHHQPARGNSLQNVTCFGCGEKGHYRDKCPRGRNTQNECACDGAYVMRTDEPQLIGFVFGFALDLLLLGSWLHLGCLLTSAPILLTLSNRLKVIMCDFWMGARLDIMKTDYQDQTHPWFSKAKRTLMGCIKNLTHPFLVHEKTNAPLVGRGGVEMALADEGGCRGDEEVEVAWMWMVAVVVVTAGRWWRGWRRCDSRSGGVMVRWSRRCGIGCGGWPELAGLARAAPEFFGEGGVC
nr:hypothetical protein [Tanacetum cinerariifolium]